MGMFNYDDSIPDFARSASMRYGLNHDYPVYLSTKNTILKAYDGAFKDIFQEVFENEFAKRVQGGRASGYEHRLIDDMVAQVIKWDGGYVWACKNYDGDVQSDTVAQGFGSLGPHDLRAHHARRQDVEAEAAHGTVTRHYREHQKGKKTPTNPSPSIFAWTQGRRTGAARTTRPRWSRSPRRSSRSASETVEAGKMTKDLAILIAKDAPFPSTEEFLDSIDEGLQAAMK